ncbi:MAG TPA: protein phosphatase 2C domain-containing protein [Gemmatimonadaceae bacterium]|jgi:serine/threonine protein phosphatase PrpC|nr:protein phosphatase 2C domain-containing protein [Gemmatimonadaceae bacterium]
MVSEPAVPNLESPIPNPEAGEAPLIFGRKHRSDSTSVQPQPPQGGGGASTPVTTSPRIVAVQADPGVRPRDDELDLCGLTHRGKVRPDNQDHYLLCTVHPQVVVHATSLGHLDRLPLRGTRLATMMMVADGVGGGSAGGEASQLAIETVAKYVSSTLRCYHAAGTSADQEFHAALRTAALEAHAAVLAEAAKRPNQGRMATTMTLGVAVWPNFYVVQVGDSRCYHYYDGELQRLTRDQTMAQDLVDRGVLPAERVAESPLSNVLVGAIGGEEAAPEVTCLRIPRGTVLLLCSDGLTRHVSDAEIAEGCRTMRSSEQLCRDLLDLALERGGTDNITVVVGRAPVRRDD